MKRVDAAALCSPESIKLTCTSDRVVDRGAGDMAETCSGFINRGKPAMPDKDTLRRAKRDKRQGRLRPHRLENSSARDSSHPRGQARRRSTRQAIAIGLSKARRAGVDLPPPEKGEVSEKTRKSAQRAYQRGHGAPPRRKPTARRKRAAGRALRREPHAAASHRALARQARSAAARRTRVQRSAAARKAARTKGAAGRRTPQAQRTHRAQHCANDGA